MSYRFLEQLSKKGPNQSCHLVLTHRWGNRSPEREGDLSEVIQQMSSRSKTRSQKAQVAWAMVICSWQDPRYNCGAHHHLLPCFPLDTQLDHGPHHSPHCLLHQWRPEVELIISHGLPLPKRGLPAGRCQCEPESTRQ